MYRIAVVEDETEFSEQLQVFLRQYEAEHRLCFEISVFGDGSELLRDYRQEFDIILLDIEMPEINGMDAAKQIRQVDDEVVLMFITNVADYAIRGYEVGALDFVIKPITYYAFSMRLTRGLKRVRRKEQREILLTLPDGVKKLELHRIYYVEVQNRMLHYHTDQGEYVVRGTMQSLEQSLGESCFAKCNYWYIVNLAHVSEVKKNIVMVGGNELEISRRSRTAFLKALADYVGGRSR